MSSSPVDVLKQAAAEAAASRVVSGMVVGLGTGSTAIHAVPALARRLRSGELRDIRAVATSFQSTMLARELGIRLVDLDEIERIDIAIDGADEVAPDLTLIKGGGGAQTREKIIAALAVDFTVVVDEAKLVDRLGSTRAVPVEVLSFAVGPVSRAIQRLGGQPELRMAVKKAGPVVTDQGNLLLDVRFAEIADPARLERDLKMIPGTLENGLFVGLARRVLVASLDQGVPRVRELLPPRTK
ncbi:MAG TPA: ribose-5-phosphate isomerase RpiA [Myxococcaceae bacterium]|jgi:ribose 5-phosphate isomerase A|nr:ribose-5-phosphate isomerase RpiA [Myxococcaceae bacterium]